MDGDQKTKTRVTRGGRNLVILGVVSIILAIITTSVSLAIYHNSGDIYLDLSRPGFPPDEKEVEESNKKKNYNFIESGEITMDVLEEYIRELQEETKNIDSYEDPFGSGAMSNEKLGIPSEVPEES